MNEKKTSSIVPNINIIIVAIHNNMVVIQVQICINTIDDIFSYEGSGVNIIIKQLRAKLGIIT